MDSTLARIDYAYGDVQSQQVADAAHPLSSGPCKLVAHLYTGAICSHQQAAGSADVRTQILHKSSAAATFVY